MQYTDTISDLKRKAALWLNPFLSLAVRPRHFGQAVQMYVEAKRHRRFVATMPRAGTNYLYALLSATDDAARSGASPEYKYTVHPDSGRGKWQFELENRIPNNLLHLQRGLVRGEFNRLSEQFFVLSHYPAVRSESLFRPSQMEPVVLIRHPLHAARSLFSFNYDNWSDKSHAQFLQNEFELIPQFLNYWGMFLECDSGDDVTVVRYEDLMSSPKDSISTICDKWGLNYDVSDYENAVVACRQDKMIEKIPQDRRSNNKRVSIKRQKIPRYIRGEYLNRAISMIEYTFDYEISIHKFEE
jgi:hypothetical protein